MPEFSDIRSDLSLLYISYFNRLPDPQGLAFWEGVLSTGFPLQAIADDFSTQAEAMETYGFLASPQTGTVVEFLTNVYQNLFNRSPDGPGIAFWSGVIEGGGQIGDVILSIIQGAAAADQMALDAKLEVAEQWVEGLDQDTSFVFSDLAVFASRNALDQAGTNTISQVEALDDAALFFDDAPAFTFTPTSQSISEGANTSGRTKIGELDVFEAIETTSDVRITGPNADLFEIDGGEVFLKAGAALDFETAPTLSATIEVDDARFGQSPDDDAAIQISVRDVFEASPPVPVPPASPVAADIDLGTVADVNSVLNVSDANLIDGFATDADSNLNADDIMLISATIDGEDVSFADIGFTFDAGMGDAGEFSIDTRAIAYDDLMLGDAAQIIITFDVSDGVRSDTGTLAFAVESITNDLGGVFDLEDDGFSRNDINFLGVLPTNQMMTAEAIAGAGEYAQSTTVAGNVGFDDFFGLASVIPDGFATDPGGVPVPSGSVALDFAALPSLAGIDLNALNGTSIATALSADDATAMASLSGLGVSVAVAVSAAEAESTASGLSFAVAFAENTSSATSTATEASSAVATADQTSDAMATADEESVAVATADENSSATSFAGSLSVASTDALNMSISNAVSLSLSAATATASNGSDAQALATDASAAETTSGQSSSASSTAEDTSNATATADDNSTATAQADETSSATSFATSVSVANAEAFSGSISNAVALTNAEATATTSAGSDALAFAEDSSTASAAAADASSASSTADFGSISTSVANDQSTSTSSATQDGSSQAGANNNSVANADARNGSITTAVADDSSAASATAADISDAQALAENGSAANSTATDTSSATATADQSSVATATADEDSITVANADDSSSATGFSKSASVASAGATSSSITNAVAILDSAATATASNSSDALALAIESSASEAIADDMSSASASADETSNATATATMGSTATSGAQSMSEATTTANDNSVANAVTATSGTGDATAIGGSAASALATGDGDSLAQADINSASSADATGDGSASAIASDSELIIVTSTGPGLEDRMEDQGPGVPDMVIQDVTAAVTIAKAQFADAAMAAITDTISSTASSTAFAPEMRAEETSVQLLGSSTAPFDWA